MKKERKSLKQPFNKCVNILTGLSISAYVFYFNTLYVWAAAPAAGGDAETTWNAVIGFIMPWIVKFGGVAMLIGGIMFGLGITNDDANGKMRKLQTLIAGSIKKERKSLKQLLKKNMTILTGLSISAYVFYINTVYAWASPVPAPGGGGGDAEAKWNAVIGFIVPWISRLGGVVMLIGGVMFGLGFKNDDADGKTRGLQTLVAGAIVIAVGSGYTIFVG